MTGRSETEPKSLPPFAVKLKALREAAGLTQEQLAERAGLHLGAIFKLEQGQREPTWATVQALAQALGTTCLAFVDRALTDIETNRVEAEKPSASADPSDNDAADRLGLKGTHRHVFIEGRREMRAELIRETEHRQGKATYQNEHGGQDRGQCGQAADPRGAAAEKPQGKRSRKQDQGG